MPREAAPAIKRSLLRASESKEEEAGVSQFFCGVSAAFAGPRAVAKFCGSKPYKVIWFRHVFCSTALPATPRASAIVRAKERMGSLKSRVRER